MFLNTLKNRHSYTCIGGFLCIAVAGTPLLGMFTSSLRRAGQSSVPTYAARTAYQYSVGSPLASRYITQPTPSWRSRIGTALNNWRQQRSYHSLNELFAVKTAEEHAKHLQELAQKGTPLSPTQAHVTHWLAKRMISPNTTPTQKWENLQLKNIDPNQIDIIMAKEKVFSDAGYHVLYHGMPRSRYILQYITSQHTFLVKKLIDKEAVPEKVPFLLRDLPGFSNETRISLDTDIVRKSLMEHGSKDDRLEASELLSCNPAVTSNISMIEGGECSLDAWNNPTGRPLYEEKKVDELFNHSSQLRTYSVQYLKKINAAIKTFRNTVKTGVLLQLVFKDPKLLQETVYPSRRLGKKRSVNINKSWWPFGKKSTDVIKIMEAFKKTEPALNQKDIDIIQYRVVLTDDKLLDAYNKDIYENFEIHAYANPQSALETFHQEIQKIMLQIEQDFNEQTAPEQPMSKKSEE
jgi:hypothetical protein